MKDKIVKYFLYSISTIVFILFLIWALLSANGRSINLWNNQNGKPTISVVQTGGIRVISNYYDKIVAEVDGERIDLKENRLERLDPGYRQIKLSLEEFNDWYTNIEIKPGIVVDVNPLFLPTNLNLKTKISDFMDIDKIFYSSYGDFAYYVVSTAPKGIDNGIFKYNLVSNPSIFGNITNSPLKISNIGTEINQNIISKDYQLYPSLDNRKLIFFSNETGYLIFDADGSNINQKPINLESKLGYLPEEVHWLNGSSSLIIRHQNLLSEFDLITEKIVLIDYNPNFEPVYGVNGDTVIFYSNSNKSLYSYRNETKLLIKLDNIKIPEKIDKLLVDEITGTKVIIESDNNYYYLNIIDSYITKIENNIVPIDFVKDGSALLYQKDGNIYSFVIDEIKPLGRFETYTRTLINNFNPEETTIRWTNSSSHIIIITQQEEVVKLSLADKKGENIIDLISHKGVDKEGIFVRGDNNEMLLLIQDSDDNDQDTNKNLYFISLLAEE
jgi:hypothetical protein